ncbi:hypothetical protein [Streptomyces flavidovirens]
MRPLAVGDQHYARRRSSRTRSAPKPDRTPRRGPLRPAGRPAATQQWFDDFRTLRILLSDPKPLHVQAFTSPDPALKERYTDQPADDGWGIDGDVIQWQPSESGFLHPWRHSPFGSRSKERDPVTAAAELSVIGRILSSDDMVTTAQETFDVPHRADLRPFGD